MKQTGIWIDKNKALIVSIDKDRETFETIDSNVEHFKIHGGSGTRLKGGPQDVVQDKTYLEREKQQLKAYFRTIIERIRGSDAKVIFGPAGTNEKFSKELIVANPHLGSRIKGVEKADSMTDNQVRAWVRHYFQSA